MAAAVLALLGGADVITAHLREDRRHIQDRDVRLLRQTVAGRLNLEMAAVTEIIDLACQVKPDQATLVPERREELTTEGGLDVVAHQKVLTPAVKRLHDQDMTGWFILLVFVPVIGGLFAFVVMGCLDGTHGVNKFGPSSKYPDTYRATVFD